MNDKIIYDADAEFPEELKTKAQPLSDYYFEKIGKKLYATSGLRGPARQARAMFENYRSNANVQYAQVELEKEVHKAYLDGMARPNFPRDAIINSMKEVLEAQVAKGKLISQHISGKAMDFSLDCDYDTMLNFCKDHGTFIYKEKNCIHISFP